MKSLMPVVVLLSTISSASLAQDSEGCSDHPLVGRMPGFYIASCASFDTGSDVVVGVVDGNYQKKTQPGITTLVDYSFFDGDAQRFDWIQIVTRYKKILTAIGAKEILTDARCSSFLLEQDGKEISVSIELTESDRNSQGVTSYLIRVVEAEARDLKMK